VLVKELRELHAPAPSFGVFGAELTIYRLPRAIDAARMFANRGLLLEVRPILRLCLEMLSWANVAFHMDDEDKVVSLKAQSCISALKPIYATAGTLYGYLSRFTHWGHVIHTHFLNFDSEQVSVITASPRYRAMSLALCLVILDVLVEVVRSMYGDRSDSLTLAVQGAVGRDTGRQTYKFLEKIAALTELDDIREIRSLLV